MDNSVFVIGGITAGAGLAMFILGIIVLDEIMVDGIWESIWSSIAILGIASLVLSLIGMAGYAGYHVF